MEARQPRFSIWARSRSERPRSAVRTMTRRSIGAPWWPCGRRRSARSPILSPIERRLPSLPMTEVDDDADVDGFRLDARRWLADHHAAAPRDYGAILPPELVEEGRAWQRLLHAEGWSGIHWPTAVGGQGRTPAHTAAWTTECALAEVPPWINMVGLVLTGGSIIAFGTPEQQAEHLPRILTAEDVWCQLFSEPGAGSDLASLS